MTLVISKLKNSFPLRTKTQDYHLTYHSKCHNEVIFSLEEVDTQIENNAPTNHSQNQLWLF
jgi:hypothetical protein